MKHNTTATLALAFSLSAITLCGASPSGDSDSYPARTGPLPGRRAPQFWQNSRPSHPKADERRNLPPGDTQGWRGPRGQGQWQPRSQSGSRGFTPGGNRNFGSGVGPMRRGFGGPPMMNQSPRPGRGQFMPPMNRGQRQGNFGPGVGPMRRDQRPDQGDDQRGGPQRRRGENRGPDPQEAPERDQK